MYAYTYLTTQEDADYIHGAYHDGQTLTSSIRHIRAIPLDASDIWIDGDPFECGCAIRFKSNMLLPTTNETGLPS